MCRLSRARGSDLIDVEICWIFLIGPVAQWIRHRPTEPGIAGSSPAGVIGHGVEALMDRARACLRKNLAPTIATKLRAAQTPHDRDADCMPFCLQCAFAASSSHPHRDVAITLQARARGPSKFFARLLPKLNMTTPGVEPGLSRPQRDVLTTRRCSQ